MHKTYHRTASQVRKLSQPCTPTEEVREKDEYFRNRRIHGGTFANTFVYIDEKCNMRCDHCYLGDRLIHHRYMSLKEIESTLDYFSSIGTRKCTIIGGEPTLSPRLIPAIRMVNRRGFECILDTNGWFKPGELLDRIEIDELEYLSFSLDGSTEDTHDANRIRGSFQRVIDNVKYAVAKGFEVRFVPTITHRNQHQAEEILALAQELGVKKVNFHTVTTIGNAREGESTLALRPEEWIAFYRKLERVKNNYHVKVWYPPTYAYEEDILRFKRQGYRGCLGRTLDRLSVFPGGTSYVCSLMFDEDKEHGGRTNAYYGVMTQGRLRLNLDPESEINHFFERANKCAGCRFLDNCHMGCPAERLNGHEDFCGSHKPDNRLIPMCRLWKAEALCG